MACTTLLVGRRATNDGSTIVARNEDGEDFSFDPKKMIVVMPEDQPRTYTGVASHLTIDLPDNPLRYTCTPNADPANGVWAETGINAANVSMSATETISANARVLGADPLVTYQPAVGKPGDANYKPEVPGGIGEENLPTITLPYIKSAREGVASPRHARGEVRHLRDQRRGLRRRGRGLVLGEHRRPPLDRTARARRLLRGAAQPPRHRSLRLGRRAGRSARLHVQRRSGPVDPRERSAHGHARPRGRCRRDRRRAAALLQRPHRVFHLHLARPAVQRPAQVVPVQPPDALRRRALPARRPNSAPRVSTSPGPCAPTRSCRRRM